MLFQPRAELAFVGERIRVNFDPEHVAIEIPSQLFCEAVSLGRSQCCALLRFIDELLKERFPRRQQFLNRGHQRQVFLMIQFRFIERLFLCFAFAGTCRQSILCQLITATF